MSCHNCPSSGDKSLVARLLHWASGALPEGSALLSSSCCWLPTVLDFVFSGSVTAAGMHRLRPVFLAISIVTLTWNIAREGLSRRNICRAVICAGLLAWAQFDQPSHSCHGHHQHHHSG